MTIKINEITNLRVEADSERRGSIAFEAGDRRFHIWISNREHGWEMATPIHSNPIERGRRSDHRELDINAATHAKLRTFLAETIGDLNKAMPQAVALMIQAREDADREQRRQLAENIRTAVRESDTLREVVRLALLDLTDEMLIAVRGAMYSADYPDRTYPSGILGIALTKKAA